MAKLGFLGLGLMGYPMARNLLRAGHQVALWSNTAAKAKELAAAGNGFAARVSERAAQAADATTPMKATKGRASFLGDRSIGHMDPGARSSSLMIAAVCEAMED